MFVGTSLDWVKSPSSFPQSSVLNESDFHAKARALGPEHPYTTNWPCNLPVKDCWFVMLVAGLKTHDAVEWG